PWRAPPPFCFLNFLVVPETRVWFNCALVPARPALRYATTTWCTRSWRNAAPKIASETCTGLAPITFSSMVRSSSLGRRTHDHVAAGGTGHRALDCDQVALGVHADHFEIHRRTAHVAHLTGHLLAREHAARGLALADRTRRAVRQRVAVGGVAHREVPALDRALEALALGHARDVDDLADREHVVHLDLCADRVLVGVLVVETELPQASARLHLRLREVALGRLGQQRRALGARGDLHRDVTVVVSGLDLGDAVGRRLDQGHGNRTAVLGEEPAHPAFFSNQSDAHVQPRSQPSLICTSTPAARSSFINASTVLSFGSTMSSTRLWVRVSYWSRASLSTCGDTRMV